jgi:hypothetical protein
MNEQMLLHGSSSSMTRFIKLLMKNWNVSHRDSQKLIHRHDMSWQLGDNSVSPILTFWGEKISETKTPYPCRQTKLINKIEDNRKFERYIQQVVDILPEGSTFSPFTSRAQLYFFVYVIIIINRMEQLSCLSLFYLERNEWARERRRFIRRAAYHPRSV